MNSDYIIGTHLCNMSPSEVYDEIHKRGKRHIKKLERIFGDGYNYEMVISYTPQGYDRHLYKLMVDTVADWMDAKFFDTYPSLVLSIRVNVTNEIVIIKFTINNKGKLQFVHLKNQSFYDLDAKKWTTVEEIKKLRSMEILRSKI